MTTILPATKTCEVENCTSKIFVKGLCEKHYTRVRRYGNTSIVKHCRLSSFTLEEIFWQKVALTANSEKCWEWQGSQDSSGYGLMFYQNKYYKAHRFAWFLNFGFFPALFLLHSCDNRICVNLNHLREGTHQENMNDAKERHRIVKGENSHKAVLKESEVLEIRKSLTNNAIASTLAKEYGVSETCIYAIKHEKNWKHLIECTSMNSQQLAKSAVRAEKV